MNKRMKLFKVKHIKSLKWLKLQTLKYNNSCTAKRIRKKIRLFKNVSLFHCNEVRHKNQLFCACQTLSVNNKAFYYGA